MPRVSPVILLATSALMLSACGEKEGNSSLSVDLNSQNGTGNVAISIPGIDAKIDVPSDLMAGGDFDIDGVKLYPKTKVTSFKLNVDSGATGQKSGERQATAPVIKMGFAAPADVATLTNWYKTEFAAKSVAATQTPTGFSGTTEDGDTFTIALTPGAAGQTNGAIEVIDAGK